MKRINFHVTKDQERFLSKHKNRTGLKKAEIIRRAIDLYMNQNNKKS